MTFLFEDTFTTDATPVVSRSAEPGPGTWDRGADLGNYNIVGGELVQYNSLINGGTYYGSTIGSRFAGRMLAIRGYRIYPSGNLLHAFGWGGAQWWTNAQGGLGFRVNNQIWPAQMQGFGVAHNFLTVSSDNAVNFLVEYDGEVYLLWRFLGSPEQSFFDIGNSTNTWPTSHEFHVQSVRVADLADNGYSGFDSDDALFTVNFDCSVPDGVSGFVGPNPYTEMVVNVPSVGTLAYRFNVIDDLDYWELLINSDGSAALYQSVSGVPTVRGSVMSAGWVVDGDRIVIRYNSPLPSNGSIRLNIWNMRLPNDLTKRIQANNVTGAGDGFKVQSLGVGGAITELKMVPSQLPNSDAKTAILALVEPT